MTNNIINNDSEADLHEDYHEDYNDILRERVINTRQRVRNDELPLEERISVLEAIVDDYALSLADHHASLPRPPISFKNARMLDSCADLLMHEYLTWDHHDKMNVVEDPILSHWQMAYRHRREISLPFIVTGQDDITIGRRRDSSGISRRIYDYMTADRESGLIDSRKMDLYDALENAGLTDRQREAIDLVYFEGHTQVRAAEEMGITDRAVRYFISHSIDKIKRYYDGFTS